MPKKTMNGIEFDVPASNITAGQFKRMVNAPPDSKLVEIRDGEHVVREDAETLGAEDDQNFTYINQFTAGGRNVKRINSELQLLVDTLGDDRVNWTPNQEWVVIEDFELPAKYNYTHTNILVAVPDKYGYGVPLRECYVDPGLRFTKSGKPVEIPHIFDNGYAPRKNVSKNQWRYLCLHMDKWGAGDNFLTFLNAIYTFLSDPFWKWKEI